MPAPREKLSAFAPSIFTIEINPERIGEVIGPGGKMIKKITAETGAQIDIQQDGKIFIAAVDQSAGRRAADIIMGMVGEIEVGTVFTGKVTRLIGMGAFVEIAPGREGLVHVSHLAVPPVRRPEEAVKLGDEIQVRVIEVDSQGRVNLSAINLDKPYDPSMAKRPDDGRGPRFGGGDRGDRDRPRFGDRGGDRSRGGPDRRPDAPHVSPAQDEDDGDDVPKARFRPRR
jgi:polyribonucleotide nucleotidyltransferase